MRYEDDDVDFYEDDPQEKRELRSGRLRVAAGVMDFLGVAAGVVAVLVLVALLVSLVNWLAGDLGKMFVVLQKRLQ